MKKCLFVCICFVLVARPDSIQFLMHGKLHNNKEVELKRTNGRKKERQTDRQKETGSKSE